MTRVFLINDELIEILLKTKIRTFELTVYSELFDEQQEFAVKLSKRSNIRCKVFTINRTGGRELYKLYNLGFNENQFDPINFLDW